MNLVIMFKNQRDFRGDNVTDLKMLKISIKQWNRFYKPRISKTYISGSYNQFEINEILNYLGKNFIEKYNITILNVGSIPPEFNTHKTNRANYQLIKTWEYLQEPFILGTNDIFPIKLIDDNYLNKEYRIRHKDYTKITPRNWYEQHWINTIKYFKEKYGFENKEIYEGHNAYVITKEFMDFYLSDPNLWFDKDKDMVLALWLKMNGKDILSKEEFCKETFFANKLQITKKDLKRLKMINVTLPNHPESKKILKKVVK